MIFAKLDTQNTQSVFWKQWRKPAKTNGFRVLRYQVKFLSHFDFHFAIPTLKIIDTLVINWPRLLSAHPAWLFKKVKSDFQFFKFAFWLFLALPHPVSEV